MRKALLHLNHILIKSLVDQNDYVVDMTCGNGYDTEFLAQISNHVFTFDIQIEALQHTKERLKDYQNITYVHDSFEHVFNYVDKAKLFVFNLGYLPGGDKSITTKKEITLRTLKKLHKAIMNGSHIVMMSYVVHEEGLLEYQLLHEYLKTEQSYQIYETEALHKDTAPKLIWIQKKDSI